MSVAQPTKWNAWIRASRPRVFTAAWVPMGIAAMAALEANVFRFDIFLAATIGVMLLQTAANLVNEYADYRRGADTLKEAGQGMVIKNKVLTPSEIRNGAILTTIAGAIIGLILLLQSGPVLWLIGIGGVIVAITYTAGPFPLAYHGLGEVAAGIFMGPAIVIGAYYVMATDAQMTPEIYLRLALISIPTMLMVAAILHANNIRDMEADRAVNKLTLAVRFGRDYARVEYQFLVWGTYITQALLVLTNLIPWMTIVAFITLPIARNLVRIFNTKTDVASLHPAQGRTAKLHGQFGLLVVIGWFVWWVVQRSIG